MNTQGLAAQSLASDPGALGALKFSAGQTGEQGKAALKETAKQFEALFMRELIKSMREATMKSGMLDGEGTDLGTDLMDQQLAVQMAGLPGGLSEAIERQLSGQGNALSNNRTLLPGARSFEPATVLNPFGSNTAERVGPSFAFQVGGPRAAESTQAWVQRSGSVASASPVGAPAVGTRQAQFVQQHAQAAEVVSRASGIPASYMLGQAGHETGWGRSEIRHADGSPSFNLFGIKATGGWQGKVAEVMTTEYENGVPRKQVARFRAYDSYEEAFRDYARLITRSPRYEQAMEQVGSAQGFALGLQRAGYATDPQYASKLSRAIEMATHVQRSI